jgi:hypothetical protein
MKRILYIWLILQLILTGVFILIYLRSKVGLISLEPNLGTQAADFIADKLTISFLGFALISVCFTIYFIFKVKKSN